MSDDGFILVKYKHPRQVKPSQSGKKIGARVSTTYKSDTKRQLDLIIKYIENAKLEIISSAFYEELIKSMQENISENSDFKDSKNAVGTFSEFVCYGIGKLYESPVARYQFALLLLLWKHFQSSGECYIYDPVFSSLDKSIIKHFKMILISKNEEAKRKVSCKTLFFIPHGGKPLYNNVLWANWGQSLANVVIFGNSFYSYNERIPSSQLQMEAIYIARILSLTHEVKLLNIFHHEDVFNDISVHYFVDHELEKQPFSFWQDCEEPVYKDDNTEIVLESSAH